MSVDEILAEAGAALTLADGQVPVHVVIVLEYLDPASSDGLTRTRIATIWDDDVTPWLAYGLLSFAADEQRERTDPCT